MLTGIKTRRKGNRNAPTVYNAVVHFVQFWNGRVSPHRRGAGKGRITNPVEMAMPSNAVTRRASDHVLRWEYVVLFKTAFPNDKVSGYLRQHGAGNWSVRARTATSLRRDAFLEGDQSAATRVDAQKSGFNTFASPQPAANGVTTVCMLEDRRTRSLAS